MLDAVGAVEAEQLARLGVCAELGGVQLDADGNPLRTALSERTIGIAPEQLRAVPEIIATAFGRPKAAAVGPRSAVGS